MHRSVLVVVPCVLLLVVVAAVLVFWYALPQEPTCQKRLLQCAQLVCIARRVLSRRLRCVTMRTLMQFPCSAFVFFAAGAQYAWADISSPLALAKARSGGEQYAALAETLKEAGAQLEVRAFLLSCVPRVDVDRGSLRVHRPGMRSMVQSCPKLSRSTRRMTRWTRL